MPSMKAGWRSGTATAGQAWPGTAALPAASDSFDPSSEACTAGYAASGSARRFAVTGLSSSRPHPSASCAGPDGGAGTRPPPAPVTTADEPKRAHDRITKCHWSTNQYITVTLHGPGRNE